MKMSRTRPFVRNNSEDIERKLISSREVVLRKLSSAGKKSKKRRYKVFLKECRFELVRKVFLDSGAADVDFEGPWVVAWIDGAISMELFSKMKAHQKINHFPGMAAISRKDLLASNLNRMKRLLPDEYDFFPLTFCLPDEAHKLTEHCQKRGRKEIFIIKPDMNCQGSGINIVKGLEKAKKYQNVVCQRYISSPLLMDSFKFDLRIYVLVTSISPLRVYAYKDGLVRLATVPYKKPTPSNMQLKRMHLTNYAINREPEEEVFEEWEKTNCKRSFSDLETFLDSHNIKHDQLWPTIDGMIVKTLLSGLVSLRHMFKIAFPMQPAVCPCFEILGFDVLLSNRIKPYLLEVNRSPSLSGSSPSDKQLKNSLVKNTLDMVLPTSRQIFLFNQEQHKKSVWRLTQHGTTRQPTARERIVAEHQEKREVAKMGRFRQIFPDPDGRYDAIVKAISTEEDASKASAGAHSVNNSTPREDRV